MPFNWGPGPRENHKLAPRQLLSIPWVMPNFGGTGFAAPGRFTWPNKFAIRRMNAISGPPLVRPSIPTESPKSFHENPHPFCAPLYTQTTGPSLLESPLFDFGCWALGLSPLLAQSPRPAIPKLAKSLFIVGAPLGRPRPHPGNFFSGSRTGAFREPPRQNGLVQLFSPTPKKPGFSLQVACVTPGFCLLPPPPWRLKVLIKPFGRTPP